MKTSYYFKRLYLFLIGLIIGFVMLSCQKNDEIIEENINKKKSATIIIDPVDFIGCQLPPYVRDFANRANQTIGNQPGCEYNAINKFKEAYNNYRSGNHSSCHYAISAMASAIDEYYRCQGGSLGPPPLIDPQPSVNGGGAGGLSPTEYIEFQKLENDYKSRMTPEELVIYEKMALKNKFAYLSNAKQAENEAKSKFPNLLLYNDKGDAFRHAIFHALNSFTIGVELSTLLGDAHEQGSNQIEKAMDLYNNAIGRSFLQNSNVGEHPADFVNRMLSQGSLRYLAPLGINNSIIPGVTKMVPSSQ